MVDFRLIQTQTGWARVLADFASWIAPEPGWKSLDVGCGPGLLPALLEARGCLSFGIDLDVEMFLPHPFHTRVALADANTLPFPCGEFQLVTATNLLFFLPEPEKVLREMVRALRTGGSLALLNPSERLSANLVRSYAEQRGLNSLARESLLKWAERAEAGYRWPEAGLRDLFGRAGLRLTEHVLQVGPGLAQYARGEHNPSPQEKRVTI